jgi:Na+/H+-dicarboxylate symporter
MLKWLGLRSLALGLSLTFAAALLAMLIAAPILARIPIDPSVGATLPQAAGSAATVTPPTLAQWLGDLVPVNPIKAAADGAMLPLLVFTILLGFALTRVSAELRKPVVGFFSGLAEAMMVLVGWVIRLAPIGVFALSVPLAARMGGGVAGALLIYVSLAAGLSLLALAVVVYPAAILLGRVPLGRLLRGMAPAQALAFSSRSTMATLPAMITAAEGLGVPEPVVAFVVPLAASMLRVGGAVGQVVAVLFAARLFGVPLSLPALISVLLTVVVTVFAIPGIPGGSIVVMVPILASAGVPAAAVGILLGADAIPDMVRTMANVTGGIAAGVIVGRERAP